MWKRRARECLKRLPQPTISQVTFSILTLVNSSTFGKTFGIITFRSYNKNKYLLTKLRRKVN